MKNDTTQEEKKTNPRKYETLKESLKRMFSITGDAAGTVCRVIRRKGERTAL